MTVYIYSAQSMSPQETFLKDHIPEAHSIATVPPKSLKPNYKDYLPPIQARRISRMIKNCYACAIETVKEARIDKPDAIITASGLGCIEPTEKFLNDMLKTNEGLLAPTSFIQSTSNAVGGQLALHFKCKGYNVLFAQKSLSFESALQDAYLRLIEKEEETILVGGFDEITEENCTLKQNIGLFKKSPFNSDAIPDYTSNGAIPGESSSFFVLGNKLNDQVQAELVSTEVIYSEKSSEEIKHWINGFLEKSNLEISDIDLLVAGFNGDKRTDDFYKFITNECFSTASIARYKHLCGEHDTASAFGTWLATKAITTEKIPKHCILQNKNRNVNTVLLYHQLNESYHSLILLRSIK